MARCDFWFRYGISGFPTLKFFPKSNKAGEDYNGGREIDDFTTFINEKCGTNRDGNGHLTAKVSLRFYLIPFTFFEVQTPVIMSVFF